MTKETDVLVPTRACACGCKRRFPKFGKRRYFGDACRFNDWVKKHPRKNIKK